MPIAGMLPGNAMLMAVEGTRGGSADGRHARRHAQPLPLFLPPPSSFGAILHATPWRHIEGHHTVKVVRFMSNAYDEATGID